MNIAQIVKKCAMDAVETSVPCDVIFGEVVDINPLKVKAGELLLEGDLVSLCDNLSYREAVINFGVYERTIVLNEGIKKNDTVILIRKQGGECYVVIGKI